MTVERDVDSGGAAAIVADRPPRSWQANAVRRVAGAVIGVVGFALSPISWWNDLVVNIPVAMAFGWLVEHVWPGHFVAYTVVGYWLSNVLGFVMLDIGVRLGVKPDRPPYSRKALTRDLIISLLYTAVVVALAMLGHWTLPTHF